MPCSPLCANQRRLELPIEYNYRQRYVRTVVSILSGPILIFMSIEDGLSRDNVNLVQHSRFFARVYL